jgi:nitroreductase
MNPVIEAIKNRRSIRKYQRKDIPRETITELLKAAAMSPSATNSQGWRFIVIEDKSKISELSERTKRQLSAQGYAPRFKDKLNTSEDTIFYNAPLVIVIAADSDDKWSQINCGIAAQTIMLAAHSLGLGSCYIGLANTLNAEKTVLADIGVPEGCEIIAALTIGYPDETLHAPSREPKIVKWIS